MKKMKLLTTVVLALVLCANVNAKTWRVNSNPSSGADYTTVQEAIDAASAGDEIQIEGGAYPGFNVTKALTILGTSFSKMAHADIESPAPVTYITGDVYIYPEASSSFISSLNLRDASSNLYIQASNTHIIRCDIERLYFSTHKLEMDEIVEDTYLNNIIILSSYISMCGDQIINSGDKLFVANTTFSNCVIVNLYLSASSSTLSVLVSFENCIIDATSFNYAYNSSFTNCIFNYQSTNFSTGYSSPGFILGNQSNNSVRNCLFRIPAPAGSQLSSAHDGVDCIFDAESEIWNNGGYYTLDAESPAKGAGVGGTDLGIYGGSSPFLLGGYRAGATVTSLTMPVQVGNSTIISVEAKVIE